ISDLPELRTKKKNGYSRLGPLNAAGRSIMFHLLTIAENLSGIKLYGLDNVIVGGYTLRQLFYEVKPTKAMEILLREDPLISSKRVIDISKIRDIESQKDSILRAIRKLRKSCEKNKSRQ